MLVRFLRGNSPYLAGEVADFSEERAKRLIDADVAEKYNDEPEQSAAAQEQKQSKSQKKPQQDKMQRPSVDKSGEDKEK